MSGWRAPRRRSRGQPTYDADVASHDPAFQWETEVLRSSRRRTGSGGGGVSRLLDEPSDWLTVREASEATGVPTSTIRKWARHENIPSVLEQTGEGALRLVSMSGIERWTDEIGRDIGASEQAPGREVDLTSQERAGPPADPPPAPEGSMIVPLDAWNRMLNQLGNLHEAGQQLAEARERAAKAETEARFLKERLADLREELESTRKLSSPQLEDRFDDTREDTSSPSMVRKVYDGWRARRRDRR